MQKLPESPYRKKASGCSKKEPSRQKKEPHSLSAVTNGVTTPKYFLLQEEGTMHPSLDDALTNLSTSDNCLFY